MATIKLEGGKIVTKGGKVSCSCCEIPQLFLEFKSSGAYCENTCGQQSFLGVGETYEEFATIGSDGPCPYDIVDRIEKEDGELLVGDPCAYYARVREQDDFTVVRSETELGSGICEFPYPDEIEDFARNYTATATGVDPNSGIVSISCDEQIEQISGDGSYAGASRSAFTRFENKITSCPILFPEYPETWNIALSAVVTSQRSRSGNLRIIDKIIYRIPEETIPDGVTLQIKKTIVKYGLQGESCTDWVLSSTSEELEDYAGGEVEIDPDLVLQQIQDNEGGEDLIETFAIDITLTIVVN